MRHRARDVQGTSLLIAPCRAAHGQDSTAVLFWQPSSDGTIFLIHYPNISSDGLTAYSYPSYARFACSCFPPYSGACLPFSPTTYTPL